MYIRWSCAFAEFATNLQRPRHRPISEDPRDVGIWLDVDRGGREKKKKKKFSRLRVALFVVS